MNNYIGLLRMQFPASAILKVAQMNGTAALQQSPMSLPKTTTFAPTSGTQRQTAQPVSPAYKVTQPDKPTVARQNTKP